MKKLTKGDLVVAVKDYDAAGEQAQRQRAKTIAHAADQGIPQKDIIEATGYSRETVRRLTAEGRKLLRPCKEPTP